MYNFKDTSECQTFVTSDTHLNHDPKWEVPIWKSRGFLSAKDMTDGIIDNINLRVRAQDRLLHLGDWCLNTKLDEFESLIARVNCQNIYLMNGNHNNPHYKNIYLPLVRQVLGSNYTDKSEVYPLKYKNVTFIGSYAQVVLNGNFAILCHFPISVWDEMKNGAWMLCGHSHHNYAPSQVQSTEGKILDVGVDGHECFPWTIDEIAQVMSKKTICKVDHHV